MAEEAPRSAPQNLRFIAVLVVSLLAAIAALVPVVSGSPFLPFVLVIVAAAGPLALIITLRSRVRLLEESARQLARGDWQRPLVTVDDETLAPVYLELDALRRYLSQRDREGTALHEEQDRSLGVARRSLNELLATVERQVKSAEETAAALHQMSVQLKGIAENVEVLATAAEESSSSILEMAAANAEVSDNMATLASSVAESATSIEEMTFSIKEVAKNVEELSSTAEETSSSMNEMDISIHQVETNANETS